MATVLYGDGEYLANEFGYVCQFKRKAGAEKLAKEARATGLVAEVVPPPPHTRGWYKVKVISH